MSGTVLAIGESLGLTVASGTGRIMRGDTMRLTFGGAESNVAIGVARLGGSAAWVGRLGNDSMGDMIVRELRGEGLTVFAARDDEVPTSLMVKHRPRPGSTHVAFYRNGLAGSRLAPTDLPEEAIRSARALHVTGISAVLGPSPRETVLAAMSIAKAAGVTVSFDVNHRASLAPDLDVAREHYREFASHADIIFAGEDEAEILTGAQDTDAQLDALLAFGAHTVVVKLGENGAWAATRSGDRVRVPAVTVAAVDTVGAGDAFVAGFLAEYVNDEPLQNSLRTAAECGAHVCLGEGDWDFAATRSELAALRGSADPVRR